MKIQIVGSGIVGTASGLGLTDIGHDILYVDISEKRLSELNEEGYNTSNKPVPGYDAYMISVPTPNRNGQIDLSYVESAMKSVGTVIDYDSLVVLRSTVPPGTTDTLVIDTLEATSGMKAGTDFYVTMNPELLREVSANDDFANAKVAVIGSHCENGGDILSDIYKPFNIPIIRMSLTEAEIFKLANNAYGALKITFSNCIGKIASDENARAEVILDTIAKYSHVMTEPHYGTMAGKPYGGACFPKDTLTLIQYGKLNGNRKWYGIFEAADIINQLIANEDGHTIPEYAGL